MRNYTNSIKVFDEKLPTLSCSQFLTQLKITELGIFFSYAVRISRIAPSRAGLRFIAARVMTPFFPIDSTIV